MCSDFKEGLDPGKRRVICATLPGKVQNLILHLIAMLYDGKFMQIAFYCLGSIRTLVCHSKKKSVGFSQF